MTGTDFNPFRISDRGAMAPIKVVSGSGPKQPAKEGELSRELVKTAAEVTRDKSISKQDYQKLLTQMHADGYVSQTEKGFLSHVLAGSNLPAPSKLYEKLAEFEQGGKAEFSFELQDFDENDDQRVDEQDALQLAGIEGVAGDLQFMLPDLETGGLQQLDMQGLEADFNAFDKASLVVQQVRERMSVPEMRARVAEALAEMPDALTPGPEASLPPDEITPDPDQLPGKYAVMWGEINPDLGQRIHCPQSPFVAYVRAGIMTSEQARDYMGENIATDLLAKLGVKSWDETPADRRYALGSGQKPPQPKPGDIAVFTETSKPEQRAKANFSHIAVFTGKGWNIVSVQANNREAGGPAGPYQQRLEQREKGFINKQDQKALAKYREQPDESPTVTTDLDTLLRTDFKGCSVIIAPMPFAR